MVRYADQSRASESLLAHTAQASPERRMALGRSRSRLFGDYWFRQSFSLVTALPARSDLVAAFRLGGQEQLFNQNFTNADATSAPASTSLSIQVSASVAGPTSYSALAAQSDLPSGAKAPSS